MTLKSLRSALPPSLILLFVVGLGAFFYVHAQTTMEEQLRKNLVATAMLAAQQIDPLLVEAVHTEDDRSSEAYRALVESLQSIRFSLPDVRFVYLVRATNDPNVATFIADADDLLPDAAIDRDGDGIVGEDEAPALPGEEYDIAEQPSFQRGFLEPSVDDAFTTDQWGTFISAYAPVRGVFGQTVAVIGLDMDATEFNVLSRSVFSPALFILVALGGAFLAVYTFTLGQRRRLEALTQLEHDRTALLDLATHQLGMPLATFRWWIEILREQRNGSLCRDTDACDQLQLGIDRMDHIVRSLHEAAALQSGTASYNASAVDAAGLVRTVVASMQSAFRLKEQTVAVAGPNDLPLMQADPKVIGEILSELLENARTFSPNGSQIVVRLSRERRFIRIDVEDHGCGIPEADQQRIFQKFVRGKNAYTQKPVGNGLGLYLSKELIERAGGRITLKSREGEGTTVSIFLPVHA